MQFLVMMQLRSSGKAFAVRYFSPAIRVTIRGGAHSVAGHLVCDDGILIDLSQMKSVCIDPVQCTACAEAGIKWIDFDIETQAFGLATTGGMNSDTGIAGLTCDNLLSANVVTADGRFLCASANENQ